MGVKRKKRIMKMGIVVIIIEALLYYLDKVFYIKPLIVNLDIYILLTYFIYLLYIIIIFDIRRTYKIGICIGVVCILFALNIRSYREYYKFVSPNKDTVIVSESGDFFTMYYDIYVKNNFFFKKRISEGNIFNKGVRSIFKEGDYKINWNNDSFIIDCWTGEFIDDREVWKSYYFKIR